MSVKHVATGGSNGGPTLILLALTFERQLICGTSLGVLRER